MRPQTCNRDRLHSIIQKTMSRITISPWEQRYDGQSLESRIHWARQSRPWHCNTSRLSRMVAINGYRSEVLHNFTQKHVQDKDAEAWVKHWHMGKAENIIVETCEIQKNNAINENQYYPEMQNSIFISVQSIHASWLYSFLLSIQRA